MTLFQGPGVSPSDASGRAQALGDVITLFGAVGDYALGNEPGHGPKIAYLATALADIAGVAPEEREAMYFAGVLHGVGALGNAGLSKHDALPQRAAMMERWNIPAAGARLCERIAALPPGTADLVRWHNEAWDGTGYPDQLRWHGIPKAAQFLHIAETYLDSTEYEESMTKIMEHSGRAFSPDAARTFLMWFHMNGGEVGVTPMPLAALDAHKTDVNDILDILSEAIDRHNHTPGRSRRLAQRALSTAQTLGASETDAELAAAGARLFGIGEMGDQDLEWQHFDPLASLGRELRARNATTAANVVGALPAFAVLAPVLAGRSEWYDGTGLPRHLKKDEIPLASRIISVCIAYDALDESHRTIIRNDRTNPIERIETAAGTQFDPEIVRAFTQALKAHA